MTDEMIESPELTPEEQWEAEIRAMPGATERISRDAGPMGTWLYTELRAPGADDKLVLVYVYDELISADGRVIGRPQQDVLREIRPVDYRVPITEPVIRERRQV